MTAPFDVTKLASQLLPCPYDGKDALDGQRFLGSAQVYYELLTGANADEKYVWIAILHQLTDGAANWTTPFIPKIVGATAANPTPWPNFAAFKDAFTAHFCAANDTEAAIAELVKLCSKGRRIGSVKDYTTEFNAAAARTKFSDEDKR